MALQNMVISVTDVCEGCDYPQGASSVPTTGFDDHRDSKLACVRAGPPQATVLFGNDWRGPYEAADVATSQIAALGLFASLL
eukprot:COSAG01_NODE_12139_length_1795_cov_0.991745_1_plen_82_part_00